MFSVVIVLALIGVAHATASEVAVTRLDGTIVNGELRIWDDDHVVIASGDGEQRLATDQLLSLDWKPEPPKIEEPSTAGEVELTDGSLIPIDDFRSSSIRATVTLAGPLSADQTELTLSRKVLAAVRLRPLPAGTAGQWQEIRRMKLATDMLVVLKRDGKSLDYVEGVMGDVSAGKIEFKLDGEPLRIDYDKVAGFIYYRNEDAIAEPRCIVSGRSGLRACVSQVRLAESLLELTTFNGAELRWPLRDIYSADFSAGKLLYLSDMEPATERWTPLVGIPSNATLAAEYGQPRRNESAYGGPLTLRMDGRLAAPTDETRRFRKGLALRSRTEILYRLPGGFRRFTTLAGIDPSTSTSGNVRLEIYGDERLLLQDEIAGQEPPRSIELDISGVKQLKILVDYGRNLDSGDWLHLCDARIVK